MTIAAQVVALGVLISISVGVIFAAGYATGYAWAKKEETKLENHQ